MKTKGYLLDTNICISMLKNKYGVREAILKAKAENCYVSEITLGELYFGASFSDNKKGTVYICASYLTVQFSMKIPGSLSRCFMLSVTRIKLL